MYFKHLNNQNSPDKRIDRFDEDLSLTVKYVEYKTIKDCPYKPNYWIKGPGKRQPMIISSMGRIIRACYVQHQHQDYQDHIAINNTSRMKI